MRTRRLGPRRRYPTSGSASFHLSGRRVLERTRTGGGREDELAGEIKRRRSDFARDREREGEDRDTRYASPSLSLSPTSWNFAKSRRKVATSNGRCSCTFDQLHVYVLPILEQSCNSRQTYDCLSTLFRYFDNVPSLTAQFSQVSQLLAQPFHFPLPLLTTPPYSILSCC
jgi:hypothetical protein